MSVSNKPGGKTGDPETDAILAEMKEDGENLPFVPEESDTEEEADDEAGAAKEEEEAETEEEDEESEDESEDEEEAESGEDKDESEDEEEDEDDTDESEEEEAPSTKDEDEDDEEEGGARKGTPVWMRLRDEKKKRKAAEALVAELQKSTSEADRGKRFEEYSKKHGLKPEAVKDLAEIVASLAAAQVGIDPTQKKEIDEFLAQGKERKMWARQDKLFGSDFENNIMPLAKRDGADVSKVRKTLHNLAFLPENAKKSLVGLYIEKFGSASRPSKKITSESGRTLRGGPTKELNEYTDEDIANMSDEEFDKMSEGLGQTHRSKISRR